MKETRNTRRLPAEWEKQGAVQLTFPHKDTDWGNVLGDVLPCFLQIAREISRFETVLIACQDVGETQKLLSRSQIQNCVLAEVPSNDTWARDHAGITVLDAGKPVVLDFFFNGWGLKFPADKDNLITRRLFDEGVFGARVEHGRMVLEGGAIESDGAGTLLTTSECLLSPNRNPHLNRAEIEGQLAEQFGLERVLWLESGFLAGDDTDSHIDTLARFCSLDTIAYVKCQDQHDEHFEALQKMENELRAFTMLNGKPYKLVPLPWPEPCFDEEGNRLPATYANFLIINGAVLVPTYRVPQDLEALKLFGTLFPDREVIGVDCRLLILQHGSLHCLTMQYPENVVNV